jgi:hypothetical protein
MNLLEKSNDERGKNIFYESTVNDFVLLKEISSKQF